MAGWIRAGRVEVDGERGKPSSLLRGGERIACRPATADAGAEMEPDPEGLDVLHEDPWLVVLDKPAGVVVHPGAGREPRTLAHRLLHHYPETADVGGPGRPGIVHRLDRDTSGVLVVARTAEAYRRLAAAFAERRVGKRYLAVVYGDPEPPEGRIARPVGRHPQRRKQMAVTPRGRPAATGYRRLAAAASAALLELDLETGRTHQIRVHVKSIGHPLVGDPLYGEARWKNLPGGAAQTALRGFPRPALHAWRLELDHPGSGERLRFEAPVPADLAGLWRTLAGEPPALPPWD